MTHCCCNSYNPDLHLGHRSNPPTPIESDLKMERLCDHVYTFRDSGIIELLCKASIVVRNLSDDNG